MDEAIVKGEYVTFGHIKGRKQVTITIEFPEEMAVEIFNILGTPVAEVSKPVAVCLLTDKACRKPTNDVGIEKQPSKIEKTEGEKLRVRAVMLCKDEAFWGYLETLGRPVDAYETSEYGARQHLLALSGGISSRSYLATNKDSQDKFKALDRQYKEWLNPIEEQYADNLSQM